MSLLLSCCGSWSKVINEVCQLMLPFFLVFCCFGQQIFVELRRVRKELSRCLAADSVEELPHKKRRMVGAFPFDFFDDKPSLSNLGRHNSILI